MSGQSVPERNHWRLLGMVLLGLVAALTIHADLCGPVPETGHHLAAAHALDGPAMDQDSHDHGDSYHCRVDHEFSPSAVAERPGRTTRHTDAGTDGPHEASSTATASAADVAWPVVPSSRRREQPSGRDILTTVCVSRI